MTDFTELDTDFTKLIDLASERLGGVVLSATDEFFAPKENLLKASEPLWLPDKYVETGKWMDGWETRRHRAPDHDSCVIRLGAPGIVRGIVADTAHFKGNFPEQCSLDAGDDEDGDDGQRWTEILAPSNLAGDSRNLFAIRDSHRYTHLRFHIYPDGGVARLRVYGGPLPEVLGESLDLAAAHNGGRVIEASDMFFGSRHNLIFPGRSTGMHDGWETRRRRGPGHDWAVIQLAAEGEIRRIEVDTLHFRGNFPESCALETEDGRTILPRTKLSAHANHVFQAEVSPETACRVRFRIYPDGGVSRLRIFGNLTERGRVEHRLRLINALTSATARRRFLECCGSLGWAEAMASARPFSSADATIESASRIWSSLAREDFLQAFAAHPRIGEPGLDPRAAAEQSGAQSASAATLDEFARLNREYELKFGYIYIVCAAGKSADQMLQLLRHRIANDPATELAIAAREQLAITLLRIGNIGVEPL
jgi:allantoicase